jgi:hypothetical protein
MELRPKLRFAEVEFDQNWVSTELAHAEKIRVFDISKAA